MSNYTHATTLLNVGTSYYISICNFNIPNFFSNRLYCSNVYKLFWYHNIRFY